MFILVHNDTTMSRELIKNKFYAKGIDFFNTLSRFKRILIISFIIIFIFLLLPMNVLKATNFESGKYLKSWIISDQNKFSVIYTHSVELTPVIETYSIDKKQIILEETIFKSYGAGLPASTPYRFEIISDGFRIYDIDFVMEDLVYRTGAIRANHIVRIGSEEYPFSEFSKSGEGVKFKIDRVILIDYIIREVF